MGKEYEIIKKFEVTKRIHNNNNMSSKNKNIACQIIKTMISKKKIIEIFTSTAILIIV